MELEKLEISGLSNTYAIANVKKEFQKAVDEPWKEVPPWQRYLKKLIADLAVFVQYSAPGITKKCQGDIYDYRRYNCFADSIFREK